MTDQANMRIIAADELGPPENYSLREAPIPVPGEGRVRVRIAAAGVGYSDALMAQGRYQVRPPTPFVPGSEFSGVVDALGPGVAGFAVGDRVCGHHFGETLAEYVAAEAINLFPLPDSLSFEAGASFLVNFQTSLYALTQRGRLRPGETLLVLGAAGGVGSAAVQLGKVLGATVIAGASSAEKRDFAKSSGADLTLDYSQPDWRDTLKKLTDGRGVDVVFDPVGGALFEPAFRSLAWGGRHLVIGFVGGPIPALPANLPLLKGAALVGVDIRQFGLKEPEASRANVEQLWSWVREGRIAPPVGPLFPFEQYREALRQASEGKVVGKIVLRIQPSPAQ